jgi:hypothetical protein
VAIDLLNLFKANTATMTMLQRNYGDGVCYFSHRCRPSLTDPPVSVVKTPLLVQYH